MIGTASRYQGVNSFYAFYRAQQRENHQGLGANEVEAPNENDNEYDAYRKRMMLAYRFRPNPLVKEEISSPRKLNHSSISFTE